MLLIFYVVFIFESFHFRTSLFGVNEMYYASSQGHCLDVGLNYSDIGPPRISFQKGNVNRSDKRRIVCAVGTCCMNGVAAGFGKRVGCSATAYLCSVGPSANDR